MHYYQHNIGDYRRDTSHLTLLEHGVYRQLLDSYYLSESKIPDETKEVCRRLCARTNEEIKAVESVLSEFFRYQEGWVHDRCEAEIAAYIAKASRARTNGKLGGRRARTKVVISGNPDVTQTQANPLTHKPINPLLKTKRLVVADASTMTVVVSGDVAPVAKRSAKGQRLAPEWQLPRAWGEWAVEQGLEAAVVRQEAEVFHDYWIAQAGSKGIKADWQATWRNWIRRKATSPNNKTFAEKTQDYKDRQAEKFYEPLMNMTEDERKAWGLQ